MSFKKGGFISIHYNDVRDLTAKLISEICCDVQVEPTLLPLTEGWMEHFAGIETNETILEFLMKQEFLDVGLFDPNTCWYSNSSLFQCYATNEPEL